MAAKNTCSFSARVFISDYSYSRGGVTESISDTVTDVVLVQITVTFAVAARKDRK